VWLFGDDATCIIQILHVQVASAKSAQVRIPPARPLATTKFVHAHVG